MNTVEVDAPKSPLEICVSLTKFCLRLCAENDSALLFGLKPRTRNGKTVNQLGVWWVYMFSNWVRFLMVPMAYWLMCCFFSRVWFFIRPAYRKGHAFMKPHKRSVRINSLGTISDDDEFLSACPLSYHLQRSGSGNWIWKSTEWSRRDIVFLRRHAGPSTSWSTNEGRCSRREDGLLITWSTWIWTAHELIAGDAR